MGQTCCGTCFCFRDVRRAIVAIGMLSGVCSFIQILVTISVFTGMDKVAVDHNDPEGVTYRLYIALACFDFVMIIASFILVYGNERANGISRCCTLPWIILLPFYFIYETGINIYYFYNQLGGSGYMGPLEEGRYPGFAIVPLVYWITKAILLFTSFIYLVKRLQHVPSRPKVRYVRHVESFNDYDSAPTFPHPQPKIALPAAPTIPRPSAPQCTSCSGGVSGDRCNKCNLPQPLYGYAGMQNGNTAVTGGGLPSIGWTMGNTGITGGAPQSKGCSMGNTGNYGGGMQAMGSAGNFGGGMQSMGNTGNCGGGMQSSGWTSGNTGNAGGAVQSKGWTTSVFNTGS